MDSIADMLTKIRNAQAVRKKTVSIGFSSFKYSLAKVFLKEGFIGGVKKRGGVQKRILIELKYEKGVSRIHEIKIISKPSKRVYSKQKKLYSPKSGYGISIISTSKGVLTSKHAKKLGVGGEIICEMW